MNIALIQPDVPHSPDEDLLGRYPPVGLAWLAGNIPEHTAEIIDLRTEPLPKKSWDLVGISCHTVSLEKAARVAEHLRTVGDDPIIVTGGHHTLPQELLEFSDYVVRGEGERTFRELVTCLEHKKPCTSVLGVLSHESCAPHRPPADLRSLNPPDYTTLSLSHYNPNQGILVTSRGCPYHCLFCVSPFGHTWRGRTPSQVGREALYLLERGAPMLHIMDDLFTYHRERVLSICSLFKELGCTWDLPNGTRADSVDAQMVSIMAEAGCIRILFGIESGVQHVLDSIGKQMTIGQTRRAVSMSKEAGIEVEGLFMVGNPGDTPDTIRKTVDFAKDLDIKGHFSLATPYPGTAFWQWVKVHGSFLEVPYRDFEQVPVFETPSFSARERVDLLEWASRECR
ncbi:MAG: radical SAM protein [Theionarchaea archaeon]|nr:radical SAM protein [Theionarchaea archaeon]MBU7000260.1 radical SAM protein [Theionarchaea archaeon]MBU7022061.1 radical SAM protein [Theionarchaea archaeon]MBU7034743.1 radical SAM protein [Theionarchaea archaeon]MBU7040470.1 radical SAM protein [Theionarchaea archaeon]